MSIGLAFLGVFAFLLMGFVVIGWWLEEHAPVRDEDDELRYPFGERLP